MKNPFPVCRTVRLALLVACAVTAASCGEVPFGEKYRGPPPAAEDISNEVAVVRSIEVFPSGNTVLLLDRERYVAAGDPHNVNRVIKAASGDELGAEVAALDLVRGDRVILSTRYRGIRFAVGDLPVPQWPGHDAYEYPIGSHAITAIERVAN